MRKSMHVMSDTWLVLHRLLKLFSRNSWYQTQIVVSHYVLVVKLMTIQPISEIHMFLLFLDLTAQSAMAPMQLAVVEVEVSECYQSLSTVNHSLLVLVWTSISSADGNHLMLKHS